MRTPSNYALRLPASLKKAAEVAASQDGATLNQFIVAAVAEKLGAYGAAKVFADRAARADFDAFDKIMVRRGGAEPPDADRL
jgi:uncharacterized protein (DUF1778 family)